MQPQMHSPKLRDLLCQARAQRAAIEAESKFNARSHRGAPAEKQGTRRTHAGGDSGEFAEPRRRELSRTEINCAIELGLMEPQLPEAVSGYGGLWGLR